MFSKLNENYNMKKLLLTLIAVLSMNLIYPQTNCWTKVHSDTTQWLKSVFFIDSINGYAAGMNIPKFNSSIIKTTNGGKSWTSLNSSFPGLINSVFFTSNNTGYIIGG